MMTQTSPHAPPRRLAAREPDRLQHVHALLRLPQHQQVQQPVLADRRDWLDLAAGAMLRVFGVVLSSGRSRRNYSRCTRIFSSNSGLVACAVRGSERRLLKRTSPQRHLKARAGPLARLRLVRIPPQPFDLFSHRSADLPLAFANRNSISIELSDFGADLLREIRQRARFRGLEDFGDCAVDLVDLRLGVCFFSAIASLARA